MTTLRMMAIDAICQRGSVRDADVVILRRAFANEPHISAGDVDALFRVHHMARIQDPSWADFFIDTMTDFVVRELEPSGYVTAAHSGWLIARVSSAGRVRSKTEHDLLLNVIDKARWVPESLLVFAMAQIRDAVTTGEGPLRTGGVLQPGVITLAEIEQLRGLLFAYGADGPAPITQAEAEILIDIDAALAGAAAPDIPPAWTDLLGKALASAILSASGYTGPTREEALSETSALRRHRHAADARLVALEPAEADVLSRYRQLTVEARALERLELQRIEIITGEPATTAEPERLAARLKQHQSAAITSVLSAIEAAGLALHGAFGSMPREAVNAA